MSGIYIVAARRTAFGTFGGKLKGFTATELATHAARAAIADSKIAAPDRLIGSSVFGNVAQTSADAAYLSRHVGLKAGLAHASTALTVNRLCGSGFQAVISAAQELQAGEGTGIALAGGTESMSQAPLSLWGHNARFGHKLGDGWALTDTLWAALTDAHCNTPMGVTAENLAAKYGITRRDADEYALRSQQAWAAAHKAGFFNGVIAPITVKGKKGPESFEVDEHPRPEASLEAMGKLAAVFKKGGDGTVTAGNASGICDGAAALVIATGEAVKAHGLQPLAKVVGWSVAGVDPSIMGIGPAPAIRQLLAKTGRSLGSVDVIEVNEAFASQVVAVERELGLDRSRLNTHGGAIALGHPLGASGARILAHLAHQLAGSRGTLGTAVGAACIGGGQGVAVMLEQP